MQNESIETTLPATPVRHIQSLATSGSNNTVCSGSHGEPICM